MASDNIFISYSRRDDRDGLVRALADELKGEGFPIVFDRDHEDGIDDVNEWSERQIYASRYVICVCRAAYQQVITQPTTAAFEFRAIRNVIRSKLPTPILVPVVLRKGEERFVPPTLAPTPRFKIWLESEKKKLIRRLRSTDDLQSLDLTVPRFARMDLNDGEAAMAATTVRTAVRNIIDQQNVSDDESDGGGWSKNYSTYLDAVISAPPRGDLSFGDSLTFTSWIVAHLRAFERQSPVTHPFLKPVLDSAIEYLSKRYRSDSHRFARRTVIAGRTGHVADPRHTAWGFFADVEGELSILNMGEEQEVAQVLLTDAKPPASSEVRAFTLASIHRALSVSRVPRHGISPDKIRRALAQLERSILERFDEEHQTWDVTFDGTRAAIDNALCMLFSLPKNNVGKPLGKVLGDVRSALIQQAVALPNDRFALPLAPQGKPNWGATAMLLYCLTRDDPRNKSRRPLLNHLLYHSPKEDLLLPWQTATVLSMAGH